MNFGLVGLGLLTASLAVSATSCAALTEPLPPPSEEQRALRASQQRAQNYRLQYQRQTRPRQHDRGWHF